MLLDKHKILFVGASGAVAEKVLPILAARYDIVGLSHTHEGLKSHCVDFVQGDLLHEHEQLFETVFARHHFGAIVWNVVRYFPGPLQNASRITLHTEFDLAVALPVACLQAARGRGLEAGAPFVLVSSQLAFGRKPGWGSYSVVKNAQVILAAYLADELTPAVVPRIVAPGTVPDIPKETLAAAFVAALTDNNDGRQVYIVDEKGVR